MVAARIQDLSFAVHGTLPAADWTTLSQGVLMEAAEAILTEAFLRFRCYCDFTAGLTSGRAYGARVVFLVSN